MGGGGGRDQGEALAEGGGTKEGRSVRGEYMGQGVQYYTVYIQMPRVQRGGHGPGLP